jgi:hypothetical protein
MNSTRPPVIAVGLIPGWHEAARYGYSPTERLDGRL